jgi:hypothetical protein
MGGAPQGSKAPCSERQNSTPVFCCVPRTGEALASDLHQFSIHARARATFDLRPPRPVILADPRHPRGLQCSISRLECRLPDVWKRDGRRNPAQLQDPNP